MTAAESATSSSWPPERAASTRSTSTSASTRSTSTSARRSPPAPWATSGFVTGHYFQDWLLHDTRLELAARAGQGRHRCARSATSARTGSTSRRSSPASRSSRSWPTWPRSSAPARSPPGPVETFATERATDTVTRPMSTEDVATILLRFANGARGSLAVSQISAGRKNSLRYEIDGSEAAAAWDSERPDELWIGHRDRPNELLLRNPALMGPAGRAAAALPGGHVEGFGDTFGALFRAIYADVAAGQPAVTAAVCDVRRRPRRDARQRRDRRERPAAAAGSTSRANPPLRARPVVGPTPWRVLRDEARPADRPVPGHAAHGGRRLDRRQRLRGPRDRLLAAVQRGRPGATPARPTSTSPT